MNIPLLKAVQTHLRQFPDQGNMGTWFCGTTCCIGGWGLRLAGCETAQMMDYRSESASTRDWFAIDALVATASQAVFELEQYEADTLFYEWRWPAQFRERLDCVSDAEDRSQYGLVMADYIDAFVRTHATPTELVEWDHLNDAASVVPSAVNPELELVGV